MRLEPYALSISHFVSSVGADAGFASIIGLAVLVLLYFAQARETASLREQAELAAQRVAQLESRLTHVAAQAQAPPPPVSGVAPLPGVLRPGGLQRPAGAIPSPGVQPAPGIVAAVSPSPPAGVGAPPLSAATKLIPTPAVQPPAIGAPGVAAARIGTPAGARSPVGSAPAVAASGAAPGTLPPASDLTASGIVTPRPATAAGGANATNGTGDHALAPPVSAVPPRYSAPAPGRAILGDFDDHAGRGVSNDLARVLTVVAAVAVLAAIVVVLIVLTSGGSSPTKTGPSTPVSNAPKPHHAKAKPAAAAVSAAAVTVAVLNGTPTAGLARGVANQLGAAGYQQGTVANAATQTQPTTTVAYLPGDQRDAAAVARSLKLGTSSVQPITPDVQALACPQTTACSANVVVTLGADQANAQTQTTG